MDDASPSTRQTRANTDERLESWKEIARFFGRTTTTVQRWEQYEGLPVHRLGHVKKGSVFAFKQELEAWRLGRTQGPGRPRDTGNAEPPSTPESGSGTADEQSATNAGSDLHAPSTKRFSTRFVVAVGLGLVTMATVGAAWIAWPAGEPLEAPTRLAVSSRSPGRASVTWVDNSSTETHFEIRQFDKVVRTTPANVAAAEFTDLDAGTSYHWDVRACGADGCSPWHGVEGKTPDGSDALTEPAPAAASGGSADILFSRGLENGKFQIHLIRPADGWIPIRLTNSPSHDVTPAWSPDRTKIAFESDRGGFSEIWLMGADGSNQVNLTKMDPAYDRAPTWSPDGKRIAFASNRSSDYEIWVMNADGSMPMNLTNTPGTDMLPAWSPDGTRLAFVSYRGGGPQVYVMQADGSRQTPLTSVAANDFPAWSPDSKRIAYRSRRDGNSEVYVMNADGSHQTNLTRHATQDETPSWSPDGTRIAFRTNRDGNYEIFSMNPDGSGLVKLTHWAAVDVDPDWGLPPPTGRRPSVSERGANLPRPGHDRGRQGGGD